MISHSLHNDDSERRWTNRKEGHDRETLHQFYYVYILLLYEI